MVKVVGEFTAIVPVPITAAVDIINSLNGHGSLPGSLTLNIQNSRVQIFLKDQTATNLEFEEYPMIKSLLVLITRHVAVQSDTAGRATLSRDDEAKCEEILVEAVRRVVTVIKRRTKQSSIDTRHPVDSYSYKYHRDDGVVVNTEFPLRPGSYRKPKYALGSLRGILTPFKPPRKLDTAMWTAMRDEVQAKVELPLYDELIYDAETLQRAMRYEQAALSAAIAVEVMLPKICSALLRRKRNLSDTQIQTLLSGKGNKRLREIFKALKPNVNSLHEDIKSLVDDRNALVHETSRNIDPKRNLDPKRMAEIINTSYKVRQILDDLRSQLSGSVHG